MITFETLHNLLVNRDKIIAICQDKGFTGLQLALPILPEQNDDLQLFAINQLKPTDMFNKLRLGNELSKLMGCKISLYTVDQVPKFLKEEVQKNMVDIGNIEGVVNLLAKNMSELGSEIPNVQKIIDLAEKFEKLKLAALDFKHEVKNVSDSVSTLYNQKFNELLETEQYSSIQRSSKVK